jgi:3-hydroxybutyryl-CoA dehydrogenase
MAIVGVLGAGTMGAGIGQLVATHGGQVILADINDKIVRQAIEGIGKRLERQVAKGGMATEEREQAMSRVQPATGPQSFADCELVIEAVAEKLDVKAQVLASIQSNVPPRAIFASNTSSLSISKIGQALGEGRRVVGMHFFNPAPLMPLVEVIAGKESDPAAVDQAAAYAKGWGKTVVRVNDRPGFIVNRVARGYYLESLRMLGEGIAGVAEIDRVLREVGGFRLGPFELMDLIGIDINYDVSLSVWEQLQQPPRLKPHPIQADLVQRSQLGRKSTGGFYAHGNGEPVPAFHSELKPFEIPKVVQEALTPFAVRAAEHAGPPLESYIFSRVLVTIINEAMLAHSEGVASKEDIDTAMRLGTNYPRGPLEWADQIGIERCVTLLQALNETVDDKRFAPAEALLKTK